MDIVGIAIRNARLTISLMLFLTLAGALAYRSIPKEAEPDVADPYHLRQHELFRHLA